MDGRKSSRRPVKTPRGMFCREKERVSISPTVRFRVVHQRGQVRKRLPLRLVLDVRVDASHCFAFMAHDVARHGIAYARILEQAHFCMPQGME